jgi:hypothetical protein
MNTEMMKEVEKGLLEIVGALVMEETTQAKIQAITMIRGLRIVINACEKYPMGVEELEQEIERLRKEIARSKRTNGEENKQR